MSLTVVGAGDAHGGVVGIEVGRSRISRRMANMRRWIWIVILIFSGISCKPKSAPVLTDLQTVQGDWELAGFKTDPTATGKFNFKDDYTFSGTMGSAKSKPGSMKPYSSELSGKFALSRTTVVGENILFVDLTISMLDGKPAPAGSGMRFSYDPKQNVLTDLLMIYFARPGEVKRVKEELERQKRPRG